MPLTLLNCAQHDCLAVALLTYGDTWRAYRLAYEMAYYDEFGCLPADAVVVERVEETPGGNRVIIHANPNQTTQ